MKKIIWALIGLFPVSAAAEAEQPAGELLFITQARYGVATSDAACDPTRFLARMCNGKSRCIIAVSDGLCTVREPRREKMLAIRFDCLGDTRYASASEGTTLWLSCR
ncbi:MAG: hypothetical protein AAFV62_03840 [Pseudomonadota bacterium]